MTQNITPAKLPLFRYWPLLAAFAAGLLAGHFLKPGPSALPASSEDRELRQQGYKFINPLLECEKSESRFGVLMHPFKSELTDLGNASLKNGTIDDIAIYFRDLNNGPWVGIDQDQKFRPASLLKIPIAMAFYKAAEEKPGILATRIKFVKETPLPPDRVQTILPLKKIELGKEYTVENLIEAMLKYSDNQALFLLYGIIPDTYLNDLYTNLGVEKDVLKKIDGTMSVGAYSTFYRILFNASYLNRRDSEKLLQLLSESAFRDGLVGGVPAGTVVAHKFGEGGALDGDRQLQDCGIVYYPDRPYLLCVMAKGRKLEDLEKFIKSVSAYVYKQVDSAVPARK